jgi:hypothetical protein
MALRHRAPLAIHAMVFVKPAGFGLHPDFRRQYAIDAGSK